VDASLPSCHPAGRRRRGRAPSGGSTGRSTPTTTAATCSPPTAPPSCPTTSTSAPSPPTSSRPGSTAAAPARRRSCRSCAGATSTTSCWPPARPGPHRHPHPGRPLARRRGRDRGLEGGRTGYPVVDAGMRQLRREGWMHNRARMIVASFLTKHLYVDWRVGAWHFMDHLVDGDLANNFGQWQWTAGTGTDSRPNRMFNPVTQSERYDPDGPTCAATCRSSPTSTTRTSTRRGRPRARCSVRLGDYPPPIVDHREARDRFLAPAGGRLGTRRPGADRPEAVRGPRAAQGTREVGMRSPRTRRDRHRGCVRARGRHRDGAARGRRERGARRPAQARTAAPSPLSWAGVPGSSRRT
jgi:hypothetical protein